MMPHKAAMKTVITNEPARTLAGLTVAIPVNVPVDCMRSPTANPAIPPTVKPLRMIGFWLK